MTRSSESPSACLSRRQLALFKASKLPPSLVYNKYDRTNLAITSHFEVWEAALLVDIGRNFTASNLKVKPNKIQSRQ